MASDIHEQDTTPSPRRDRYTIAHSGAALAFKNYPEFPYALLRKMSWDEKHGFTELINLVRQPFQIATVIDWETQRIGAIFQVNVRLTEARYYWHMYKQEYGADNQPHVDDEFYWIDFTD